MVESTTGKNALRDALGEDAYRIVGRVSETGAAVTVTAGLGNPDYGVKNNQAAHFEQVPRAGEGGSGLIPDNPISGGQKPPEGINYREYDVNLYTQITQCIKADVSFRIAYKVSESSNK